MRVLIVSAPMLGHVFPMVPLARALRTAGHEVLVATAGEALRVREAGLPVRDVAPGINFGRIAMRMMLGHPVIARAELTGTAGTRGVALLFGEVNAQLADGVLAVADEWAPDLVVHEPLAVAGAVAAARRGVPAVRHETMLFDGRDLVRVTADRIGGVLRRHGVDELPPPAAAVAVAPPSVVAQAGWPMRYGPYSGEGELPAWLREPGDRPRLLVSRSTVAAPGGGDPMKAVVAVAERVDAEIVLVRPGPKVTGSALPGNVRTVDWIPLAAALPACAGVVHHGGAGTVLGALSAGVPQLVVTGPGDRTHNARLVAARGAGLARPAREVTAADLDRLFTDPGLRRAAGEVRAELAARPGPTDLVRQIEVEGWS